MAGIAEYLLGQARSRVLSALLLHPERSQHVRELARTTGSSAGSLHRELRGLSEIGLVLRSEIGRQVHYQANIRHPVFLELAGLLRKTVGVADVLRDALSRLGESVTFAFVYGSIASGTESARSDVDVMVLGSATFAEVSLAFSEVSAVLGREVNPTPMRPAEFFNKLTGGNGFAVNVAGSPKIWLKGGQDDFAELVAHRKTKAARRHSA